MVPLDRRYASRPTLHEPIHHVCYSYAMRKPKQDKVALVVAERPPDAGLLDLLRLTGYAIRFEPSVAAARASLNTATPQLAVIADVGVPAELEALFEELRVVCPQIVVASTDDATVVLADRLGLLIQRDSARS